MKKSDKNFPIKSPKISGYETILREVAGLLESARRASVRATNTIMTATYWEIGRRIVEFEQGGSGKADYGKQLVENLSRDLTARFGRGFGRRNLFQMRAFYVAYPEIVQTVSAQFSRTASAEKSRTLSGQLSSIVQNQKIHTMSEKLQTPSAQSTLRDVAQKFPLPWSHYVLLLSVKNPEARAFYEAEALRGGWSVRQLDRQIATQFYERTALSRNKAAMLKKGAKLLPEDIVIPEEEIKDPFVLEFLGLKDEYSENDLEEALILQLENFLLELGGDFAFVGRQRRLRIGDEWYRVDLLFYHRRLRCLVIIDLKLGKFTHADAGQMHLYLNYAREHWTHSNENPPVGLILCAQKDYAVAHYALEGLPNKVLAAEYRTALPDEKILVEEIKKTRKLFDEMSIVFRGK
jgi:predicted nuclease of restriction endonuclease-like (RecB) superfamily